MVVLRNPFNRMTRSSRAAVEARALLQTADRTFGMSNLATMPFAGNISTDTRAG